MLSPDFMEWLEDWPEQPCPLEAMSAWLDLCPIGRSLEGPNREVARRVKGKQKWAVSEYHAPEPGTPKKMWYPVGIFSSKGLCLRWEGMSQTHDLQCLQPALTSDELHHLVYLVTSGGGPEDEDAVSPPSPDGSPGRVQGQGTLRPVQMELTFGYDTSNGVVILGFGQKVSQIGLDASAADDLGDHLKATATLLRQAAH